jgi:hypothetical protein
MSNQEKYLIFAKSLIAQNAEIKHMIEENPENAANFISEIFTLLKSKEEIKVVTERASANIGKTGELNVKSIIENHFGDIKIKDTSKEASSGDLQYLYKKSTCIIEIKNWKASVPIKEYEKMYKDCTNCAAKIGIMISLQSRITNKKAPFDFQQIGDEHYIYVSPVENIEMKSLVIMAIHYANFMIRCEKTSDYDKMSKMTKTISKIDTINDKLIKEIKLIKKYTDRKLSGLLTSSLEIQELLLSE